MKFRSIVNIGIGMLLLLPAHPAFPATLTLAHLTPNTESHGFRAISRFLNDANKPMGARFVHVKTGFTFDLLQIPSALQGFIWVRSFPTSDKGEPHTQEHLLLGKGNKGKFVSNLEGMSLVQSSAYTQQWQTCYHFHTIAGTDVFYNVLKEQLDALLHPDYSDEEIRREVCNFGVTEDAATHTLRLEEKGTVYNEMVSTYERPWSRIGRDEGMLIYGDHHPLSYESGGLPSAIRTMTPQDIRTFHAGAYHLANMGMVGSFGPDIPMDSILMSMDSLLLAIPDIAPAHYETISELPPPSPAPAGTIHIAEFPDHNERRPSPVEFTWPANRALNSKEKRLIDFFIGAFAGDATTTLYKTFVDTKTRIRDIGANDVYGYVSDDPLHPVTIGFSTITPSLANEMDIARIRTLIQSELSGIAMLADGSRQLKEFNARVRSRVVETRRAQSKFVNSPPGYGFRGGGSGSEWMNRLNELSGKGHFDISVTYAPELAFVDSLLNTKKNFWKAYIMKWKLTEAPYAVAGKPSAALLQRETAERAARSAAEVERLKSVYHVLDAAQAIGKYRDEYDRNSAVIDSTTRLVPTPPFINNPPMTLDDKLVWEKTSIPMGEDHGGWPIDTTPHPFQSTESLYSSLFENLPGATIGFTKKLPYFGSSGYHHQLVCLSILPELLTQVGAIENGRPVSYEVMTDRIRNEILDVSAYWKNTRTMNQASQLVVRASGNTPAESRRAIQWMSNVLYHPDWRIENLPRIRDVVDQMLSGLRRTMQGSEESWVNDPAQAYTLQSNPNYLATSSFLTKTHNVYRLKWMLKDPGSPAMSHSIEQYLDTLRSAAKGSDRESLLALLHALQGNRGTNESFPSKLQTHFDEFQKLSDSARAVIVEAAKDLEENIAGVPDESLEGDWSYLCSQMRKDFLVTPVSVLKELEEMRARLCQPWESYMFLVSSHATRDSLRSGLREFVSHIDTGPSPDNPDSPDNPLFPKPRPMVKYRLAKRLSKKVVFLTANLFVGLVNPNTQSGVFLNSAWWWDSQADHQWTDFEHSQHSSVRFLATKLFGGHGAHSMFMKTWSAGLAYSNGLSSSLWTQRTRYYAERCPELPQTIRFVIDELKKAPRDVSLVDYAIAQVFGESHAAESFEARGEERANEATDDFIRQLGGVRVKRQAILDLRKIPDLSAKLYEAMDYVYGSVLPGYDKRFLDSTNGTYFVIGPERQMQLYEAYLKESVSPDAVLYRLYPRDFWMVGE